MTSLLEKEFKKRLQLIAKERHLTPAVIWHNVISDRFLARLCQSPYRSNFILKGGTLLAKYLNIGRETKDLDFSIENLERNAETLHKTIEEIISIDVNDGFVFKNVRVEPLNHFHVNYPGAQIRIDSHFYQNRFSLFIDLGFGDHVKVEEKDILLLSNSKGPLFEKDISIACYPMEFVFAEKLETVVYLGAENSRMKDFHDLFSMVNEKNLLKPEETQKAIEAVFNHRRTPLQLPINFDASTIAELQKGWDRYLSSVIAKNDLPGEIEEIIAGINTFYLRQT